MAKSVMRWSASLTPTWSRSAFLGDTGAYFTDQPLFQQVPAVAEGRAVITEGDEAQDFTWGLTRAGILGKLWALDTFEDLATQPLS